MRIELEKLKVIKKREEHLTDKDMEHIIELREEGYTYQAISDAYSRNYGTIAKYIKMYQNGESINELLDNYSFDFGKLKALMMAGRSIEWIAVEFKTDVKEIRQRLKELTKIEKKKSEASVRS